MIRSSASPTAVVRRPAQHGVDQGGLAVVDVGDVATFLKLGQIPPEIVSSAITKTTRTATEKIAEARKGRRPQTEEEMLRSKPRCERCPLVLSKLHKARRWGCAAKNFEKVYKRARKGLTRQPAAICVCPLKMHMTARSRGTTVTTVGRWSSRRCTHHRWTSGMQVTSTVLPTSGLSTVTTIRPLALPGGALPIFSFTARCTACAKSQEPPNSPFSACRKYPSLVSEQFM